MDDKNPLLNNKDNSIKEDPTKLGFNTNPPLEAGEKVERFQKHLPGKKLRVWTKLCTIFGIIFSVLTMMYYLLPFFAAIIGGVLAAVIVLFMIFSVIVTLGLILMNDGYRNWIGNDMMNVPNFFFNIADNILKLSPYFLVVAIPGLVFTLAGFVLSIIGKSKQYRFFTSYIVLNAIFLTISLFFMIIYIAAGGVILTTN